MWRRSATAAAVTVATAIACVTPYSAAPAADAPGVDPVRDSGDGATGLEDGERRDANRVEDAAPPPAEAGDTFPPACDPAAVLGSIDCSGRTQATCGSALAGYAGGADDLIECLNGSATCVRRCPHGCLTTASPATADQCDDCEGRANGWYCGEDMKLGAPFADLAVHCQDGRARETAFCGMNLCHSVCTRPGATTSPACCQTDPEP